MSIKRTIITAIVGLTLVALVAPAVTSADQLSDLQAMIATLQAQLNALQGGTVATGTGACTGVTFTRNLTVGATGSDVKCLQSILNRSAATQVSATGAGAPGYETTTFGPKTLAAVKKYQTANGLTPANQVGPLTRAKLNSALGTVVVTPGQPPVVVPTGAGLSVMLASDNPASGTIVVGSALTPLAKFVFVNGDNAPVTVTGFKVTRIGVSADTDLQNVYLLQGATRLTDSASVASGLVSFNDPTGLFTVPAGGSTEITVASDIYSSANAGETVGLQLAAASNVVTNASSVKGSFPVNGNLMTTAGSSSTLAGVQFAAAASVLPGTNSSLNPQMAYPVFQDTVTVSTRTVNMTRIAFREIGSAYATDLQNFVLNVDGTNVGSAVPTVDKNGYVTFDLASSPLVLQATSHTIKLMADIMNGSSRNFYFSIRVAADANFVDTQYGANVLPTLASGSFPLAASSNGVQTIASGTITVTKAVNSPSGNVVLGASNAPLADFTFTAAGEPVKVTDLYFCITDATTSPTTFRNGALYANGVQVGSTTNIASSGTTNCTSTGSTHFSLGSAMIVTPGSPVTLEVRADIHEGSGPAVANGDSVQVNLIGTSTYFTAQDMISLGTPTAPSTTQGATLTVAQGSLVLSQYNAYTNQTIVVPQTGYQLGHFTLTGSTTEATNINTIYADLNSNTTTITNYYVQIGTLKTTPISNPSATTKTNSWAVNYVLPAGQTVDVIVYGDLNSSAAGTVATSVEVDGYTANSVQSAKTNSGAVLSGQTITIGSGNITGAQDPATPVSQAVAAGQPVTTGIFRFTAQNDSYTITELKFSVGATTSLGASSAASAVTSVALKDNSTGATIATAPVQYLTSPMNHYAAYFTGLTIPVTANTAKSLAVVENISSSISSDTASTNVDVEPYLTYYKVSNSSGTPYNSISNTGYAKFGTRTANKTYVFKAVPTVNYAGTNSSATSGSNVNLYNFTVGASNGPVTVKQFKFTTTMTNNNGQNNNLDLFTFFRGSTNITNSVSISDASGNDLTGSTTSVGTGTVFVTFTTEENVAQGSTNTYTLKANVNQFTYNSTNGADAVSVYMPYSSTYDGAATTGSSTCGSGGSSTCGGAQLAAATTTGANTIYYVAPGTATTTNGPSIIWSDGSASYPTIHGYGAAGSSDWYDSYLVLTGSLPTQTVNAQ